jgi:serine/threonine protein kinase
MIITPLMSNGNLRQYLSTKNWDRTEGIRLLTETAKGLRFLHGISVVHGDLKALNVLVDEKYKAKLADFGLSRLRSGHSRSIGPGRGGGTEGFQAPEVLRRQAAKEPADVYSFAMLCYEVLSGGAAPFHDRRAGKTVEELVLDSQRPGCPKGVPDRLYRLMCGCWVQNPKDRLTMIKVVEELEEISRLLANRAFSSC